MVLGRVRVGEERCINVSLWWRGLCKVCGGQNLPWWYDYMMKWKIGNGRVRRFWLDNWMGEGVLASC